MNVFLLAAIQAVALQTAPSEASPPTSPIIWRDFRADMTAEAFASGLQKVDGIKAVEVIRKGTKPARVRITYATGGGLPVGALNVVVNPVFTKTGLASIQLTQAGCYSAIVTAVEQTMVALGEKYPSHQNVKVIGDDGVKIDTQRAFFNSETRVTVSVSPIENPYPEHVYGGTGFLAAANKVANAMADSNYNSANEACPTDKGRKATLSLNYMSQNAFLIDHSKEEAGRKAKAAATKDGL